MTPARACANKPVETAAGGQTDMNRLLVPGRGNALGRGTAVAVCGVSVSLFGVILTQFVGFAGFGVLVGIAGVGLSFVGAVIEADRERFAIAR